MDENRQPQPELIDVGVLERITKAERESQIDVAKRYPRSLSLFHERSLALATHGVDVAASCFYAIPRAGKLIEGPSVRLAEIVASSWGNLRCESRVIDVGDSFVTSEGSAWDLETNYANRREVRRRITTKEGLRYNDDMIMTTGNAACSIAFRNAVFSVVPSAHVNPILEAARRVAVGDQQTLAANVDRWLALFVKGGITTDRVLASLGARTQADLTLEDLRVLQATLTALRDGDLSPDEAFPVGGGVEEPPPEGKRGFGFKGRAAKTTKPAEPAKPAAPAASPAKPAAPAATPPAETTKPTAPAPGAQDKAETPAAKPPANGTINPDARSTGSMNWKDGVDRVNRCTSLPELENVIVGDKRMRVHTAADLKRAALKKAAGPAATPGQLALGVRQPTGDEPPHNPATGEVINDGRTILAGSLEAGDKVHVEARGTTAPPPDDDAPPNFDEPPPSNKVEF